MIALLISDIKAKQRLYAQYGGSCSFLRALLTDGTSANVLYRVQEFLSSVGVAPLALMPHILNKWFNGCVIGVKARFGAGFVLIHPVGVVINSSVRGGRDVWIESGVVIGDNRGRSPELGNGIFIGSGAKIIGGLTIEDGARVGANAVVTKDVGRGVTVVGIPARPLA